jgi:hypothetical protein
MLRLRSLPEAARIAQATALRGGPYRIYFVSHDLEEPAHVHVDREKASAKFWLQPVSLARNLGFSAHELRAIEKLIVENSSGLLKSWNEYFGA